MSFEHLYETQSLLAKRLRGEFENNLIPQSLLFSGPAYSSRMTAAIETALAFMGQEEKFDTLNVNDLVILSSRDNEIRYRASYELFKKHKTSYCFNFLLRTVRTYLYAFHPSLSPSGDSATFSLAADVADHLYINPKEEERDAWCKELDKKINKLFAKTKNKGGFTIDNVRDLSVFFQQGASTCKVAILENIEQMNPSAVNSLLKMLEEPAPNSHIILISSHPERILETILSRVRKYDFPQIASPFAEAFLKKFFFCYEKNLSIEEFFYKASLFDFERAKTLALNFAQTLLVEKRECTKEELEELGSFLDSSSAYPLFIGLVSKECERLFLSGGIEIKDAEKALQTLSSSYNDAAVYNQNKRVLLDRLSRELS